jgi:heat shock protein HtpX
MKTTAIFKTTLMMAAMVGLFMLIGQVIGGQQGALMALVIAAVMNFGMYWFSGSMVLKMQGAVPLDENRFPQVRRIVQEITQKDNLPMPKLYFVETPIPNAFATGRNPQNAVVAVTAGIMEILDERELYGVLAHEVGHVKNYDMLVSTIAATLGGAISYLAQMAFFFGGSDEESPNPIAMIAMVILAPVAAMLIQMAVSRTREFGADEHGKKIMNGDGRALASALQKLEAFKPNMQNYQPSPSEQSTAHLMFANMFNMQGLSSLFSTHPSTKDRVERLLK